MNCQEFDLQSLNFLHPIFNDRQGIFISNTNNSNITLNSAGMKLTSINNDVITVEFLYSQDSDDFYKFIGQLDTRAKNTILDNGVEWFGSGLNEDTINNMFKRTVTLPDCLPSFPTMKFIVLGDCKISGTRKKKMTVNDLKEGMEIIVSFYIEGIFFYKNRCCLVYKARQIKVLNNICQTLQNLFGAEHEVNYIESETYDITASIYQ